MRSFLVVVVAVLSGCATQDDHPDGSAPDDGSTEAGLDAGPDGAEPPLPPQVHFVEPGRGPTAGGTAVVITGSRFRPGATGRFGGVDAACSLAGDTRLDCTSPAHAAGAVDVEVGNPNGQTGRLAGGFTYVDAPPEITQAILVWPARTTAFVGRPSEAVFGRVTIPGVTDAPGPAEGVRAQLGWGADAASPDAFTWADAEPVGEVGVQDEYAGTLTIDAAGTFSYAMRFSADDGEHWVVADLDGLPYDAAQAGSITVEAVPEGLFIETVEPSWGAAIGGETVTIAGSGIDPAATVTIGGAAASDVVVAGDGTSLTAVTQPHVAGRVDIIVRNPDASVGALGSAYEYVWRASPIVDGSIGDDWPAEYVLADNAIETDWGVGLNEMHTMRVAWDDDVLTIAIDGLCEADNAILLYLDADYGAGSGLRDATVISDGDGALDIAIGGRLAVSDPAFGADWASGSKGMASVAGDALSGDAGWRLLFNVDDLGWAEGAVAAGPSLETSIPLSTVLPGGVPPSGATLAIFARLVNRDGEALSNQTLPFDDPAVPEDVSVVATFRVR